ncbi:MAG: hypothetical protein JXB48_10500 [Candidatus Latescibacteria bacterium]|nr:hypothetical protein [Candidatus Latescibacterota bacterium]
MAKVKLEDILNMLDIVVLKKQKSGSFSLIGNAPGWFKTDEPNKLLRKKEFTPEDYYPFLESFLVDAEWFWTNQPADRKRFRSAPWFEEDTNGNEYYLEASAVVLDGNELLLIERLGDAYREKALILQKAREKALELEYLYKSHKKLSKDAEELRDLYDVLKEELFRDLSRNY